MSETGSSGAGPSPQDAFVQRVFGADPASYAARSAPAPAVGEPERAHAADLLGRMSPADQATVAQAMQACGTAAEADYTTKALTAGHSPADIAAFQAQIAGKDEAWMQQNLHLAATSTGKGARQQWSFACQATAAEAIRGEMDPMFALQMHLDDARPAPADPGPLDAQATGLSFGKQDVGSPAEMSAALDTAQEKLRGGMPVPITATSPDGAATHASMMTAVEDGPPRRYAIHDPASGSTSLYAEEEIRGGKLAFGTCTTLQAIYPPTQH